LNLEQVGRILLIVAAVIAVTGVIIFIIGKGLGVTKLPGDIIIRRDGWRITFPIATSILISVVLTIIINVVLWLLRR